MKIHKNTFYIAGIILIIIVSSIFLFSTGEAISPEIVNNQEVQIVELYVENGNYVFEPRELKKDVLVRIDADVSKMPGCSRSIRIPAFGISKTFSSDDNIVEFIPTKAGTFNIACSMNMYKGSFSILESDGSKSDYAEQKLNSGSSCGMGGGCGCGA